MKHQAIEQSKSLRFKSIPPAESDPKARYGRYSIQLSKGLHDLNFRLEHPRPGLSLSLVDWTPSRDIVSPFAVGKGAVSFCTVLSGRSRHMAGSNRGNPIPEMDDPCDLVFLCDNYEGKMLVSGQAPQRFVSIILQTDLLRDLLGTGDQPGHGLLDRLDKGPGMHLLDMLPASPQTQLIAAQVLACPLTGVTRKLFLESKSLELLSLLLERMDRKGRLNSFPLSNKDVEKLHEAKRILFTDMAEPPSVRELAKRVGINEFKLKKGFREVFGHTAYEALRIQRMYVARGLLLDTDMTAGTVAAAVGYTNLSHFISAFRAQFGITPGALLRCSRRNHCFPD